MYRAHNSKLFLARTVGDFSKVSFKASLNDKTVNFDKKLEMITLSGYISLTESLFI